MGGWFVSLCFFYFTTAIVKGAPVHIYRAVAGTQSQYSCVGDYVQLYCTHPYLPGKYLPSPLWKVNRSEIKFGEAILESINSSTSMLTWEAKTYGDFIFSCFIVELETSHNSHIDSNDLLIYIQGAPLPPTSLTFIRSDTSISLMWSHSDMCFENCTFMYEVTWRVLPEYISESPKAITNETFYTIQHIPYDPESSIEVLISAFCRENKTIKSNYNKIKITQTSKHSFSPNGEVENVSHTSIPEHLLISMGKDYLKEQCPPSNKSYQHHHVHFDAQGESTLTTVTEQPQLRRLDTITAEHTAEVEERGSSFSIANGTVEEVKLLEIAAPSDQSKEPQMTANQIKDDNEVIAGEKIIDHFQSINFSDISDESLSSTEIDLEGLHQKKAHSLEASSVSLDPCPMPYPNIPTLEQALGLAPVNIIPRIGGTPPPDYHSNHFGYRSTFSVTERRRKMKKVESLESVESMV